MQSVISNLDGVDLHLEYLILNQIGVQSLPFVGMDSKYLSIFLTLIRESWKKNPKLGTITERVLREKIQSAALNRFVYVSVLWIFFQK